MIEPQYLEFLKEKNAEIIISAFTGDRVSDFKRNIIKEHVGSVISWFSEGDEGYDLFYEVAVSAERAHFYACDAPITEENLPIRQISGIILGICSEASNKLSVCHKTDM